MFKKIIPWFLLITFFSLIGIWTYNMFNAKNYQIKFDVDGGSRVEALNIKKGQKLEVLPKTSKDNYEFVGWYLDDELFDLTMPITKDLTLVAKWTLIDAEKCVLSFDTLNGDKISNIIIDKNSVLESYPIPTKIGYTFKGWYYHNKEYNFTKPIVKNMTFVAKWIKE